MWGVLFLLYVALTRPSTHAWWTPTAALAIWVTWRTVVIAQRVRVAAAVTEPSIPDEKTVPLGPVVGGLISAIPLLEAAILAGVWSTSASSGHGHGVGFLAAIVIAGTFLTKWLRKRISFT
jgi:hypothetical protein